MVQFPFARQGPIGNWQGSDHKLLGRFRLAIGKAGSDSEIHWQGQITICESRKSDRRGSSWGRISNL